MDRWNKAGQKEVILSRLGPRCFFRKYDFVSYVRVAYMPPEGSTRTDITHTYLYVQVCAVYDRCGNEHDHSLKV